MRDVILPVEAHLPAVMEALIVSRAVMLTAPAGAGKINRVPPAILVVTKGILTRRF